MNCNFFHALVEWYNIIMARVRYESASLQSCSYYNNTLLNTYNYHDNNIIIAINMVIIGQAKITVEPLNMDTPNSGHLRPTDIWPLHRPIFLYN